MADFSNIKINGTTYSVKDSVARNAMGGPNVAATKAAMTDKAKVYVYTGSESGMTKGNWYYWNGSAWTSGGVYQSTGFSTDTTLTVSGMAADAKVTGDNFVDLENAINGIFTFSNISNRLEIGSFTTQGLNASATNRLRSREYYPVTPNTEYYLGYVFNVSGTYGQSSVSFYAAADYSTPRMSAESWDSTIGGHKFTTPDGCHYVRLLFKRGNDSAMDVSDFTGVYFYDYSFNTAFIKRLEYSLVAVTNPDLNNLTEYRYYTISGQPENMQHIPETAPYENALLEVYRYPNGAIVQRIMYTISGSTYERLKGTDGVWRAWAEVGPRSYNVRYLTNPDLNNLTDFRYYSITGNDLDTTHNPVKLFENRVLEVIPYSNGAIFQRLTYTYTGQVYTRLKGTNGVWRAWSRVNSPVVKFIYYAPVPSEFALNNYVPRDETTQGGGDIAFYNNKMFGFSPLHMFVDGNDIAISNGHGNNCMFGTEVHGTYPYLYCASWDKDDCKIFVNQVTETSATLARTINYSTLSGYLNACVDEPNNKIYILLCVSDTTQEGSIRFVVSDLNGTIESNTAIEDIPIVQGMTFYKGRIYVLSGDGSATYPNTLTILDVDGNIVSKSDHATMWGEFEGIDIYKGTMYIATRDSIFNN